MMLGEAQRRVAIGMAAALAVTLATLVWAIGWPASNAGADLDGRVQHWATASALATVWVAIAVARLAAHRFFTPADLDAAASSEGTHRALMLQALLQNTLEQAFLAVVIYGVWSALMDGGPTLAPVFCALLFSIGRIAFFVGYERGAGARAFGFGLTFYPTCGLLLLLAPSLANRALAALS